MDGVYKQMNEKINKTMSKQYLTQGAHAVAAMGWRGGGDIADTSV
jgi:hypothetical protein